jgi:uncharacterized membrane protein (UPF0127 family)
MLVSTLLMFLPSKHLSTVTIKGKTFFVYVARTDEQKTKGLSIFKTLPLEKGMIFPFSTLDYYTFWMKDMKFPIDIIYIRQNRIVDIFPDVPFPKNDDQQLTIYKPSQKANYVLEINAGLSRKYNFRNGDFVKINL